MEHEDITLDLIRNVAVHTATLSSLEKDIAEGLRQGASSLGTLDTKIDEHFIKLDDRFTKVEKEITWLQRMTYMAMGAVGIVGYIITELNVSMTWGHARRAVTDILQALSFTPT